MRANQHDGWTVKDEIFFLENIGKFSDFGKLYDKSEILRNYISASEKRADWDGMNKDRVLRFARNMLDGGWDGN
jgi:hypothetical protein